MGNTIERLHNPRAQRQSICRPFYSPGYTLVELIIVVALLALFLSLGMPSLREAIYVDPLKSTARKVIGTVRNVRLLAAEERRPYRILIDRIQHKIWYEPLAKPNNISENADKEKELTFSEEIVIKRYIAKDEDKVENEQISLSISDKGYVNRIRLQLSDSGGDTLYLDFYPFIIEPGISENAHPFTE